MTKISKPVGSIGSLTAVKDGVKYPVLQNEYWKGDGSYCDIYIDCSRADHRKFVDLLLSQKKAVFGINELKPGRNALGEPNRKRVSYVGGGMVFKIENIEVLPGKLTLRVNGAAA